MSSIPEIKGIYRITGLSGMEEAMANLRSLNPLLLFVEDTGNSYLDLSNGNVDNGFHAFSIVDVVKINDSQDRCRALDACMSAGLRIIKRMLDDSHHFGWPIYGIDPSRIEYMNIGPMVNNTYGYMYTYMVRCDHFHLI